MSANQDLMHIHAIQMLRVRIQLEASIVRATQGSLVMDYSAKVPTLINDMHSYFSFRTCQIYNHYHPYIPIMRS